MTTKRWIAEGATVLEEGGSFVICTTEDYPVGSWYDAEGLQAEQHRMAQRIADEHNALLDVLVVVDSSVPQTMDAYNRLDEIQRIIKGATA